MKNKKNYKFNNRWKFLTYGIEKYKLKNQMYNKNTLRKMYVP